MKITRFASHHRTAPTERPSQDAVLQEPDHHLFAIADGTGKRSVGARTIDSFRTSMEKLEAIAAKVRDGGHSPERVALTWVFEEAFQTVNESVAAHVRDDDSTAGSSMVAAFVVGRLAYIAHVGNVRGYVFRNGALDRVTVDHTAGMAQVARGALSRDRYESSPLRSILTMALGRSATVEVDVAEVHLQPEDVLVLTSDGLTSPVDDATIAELISPADLNASARNLTEAAHQKGGQDDASVVLIEVGAPDASEAPPSATSFVDAMGRIPVFQALESADVRLVAPYLEERFLEAGDSVCTEGDPGESMFAVVSGRLKVTRGDTDLVDIGPGGHFGELSMVLEGNRTATVTALEETSLLELPRAHFLEISARKPEVGVRLCMGFLKTVAGRLSDLTDRVGFALKG